VCSNKAWERDALRQQLAEATQKREAAEDVMADQARLMGTLRDSCRLAIAEAKRETWEKAIETDEGYGTNAATLRRAMEEDVK